MASRSLPTRVRHESWERSAAVGKRAVRTSEASLTTKPQMIAARAGVVGGRGVNASNHNQFTANQIKTFLPMEPLLDIFWITLRSRLGYFLYYTKDLDIFWIALRIWIVSVLQ